MDGYLLASRIGSAWLRGTNTHPWFRFSNAQFLLEDVDSVKSKLSWIPQLLKVPMQQMPAWISCFQSIPRTGYSVQLIVWGFFGLVPTPTPVLVCIRKKKSESRISQTEVQIMCFFGPFFGSSAPFSCHLLSGISGPLYPTFCMAILMVPQILGEGQHLKSNSELKWTGTHKCSLDSAFLFRG